MRIRVQHQTSYRYDNPAHSALQLLRLTPRSHEGQFVRRWRVEVDADARLNRGEDAYGNITHHVYIEGPIAAVMIQITGEIDTLDTHGVVRGAVERLPVRFYLRETPLTAPTPEIRAFARDCQHGGSGEDRIAVLHRITSELNQRMTFAIGATTTRTTAGDAFLARAGVCQDYAHIFCAAARSLGVPARYVSGYYLRSDSIFQDAGHGWAEAHVDGLGWVGFDPAQGLSVTDRYVRIAIGTDYLEASPVRGSQSGGGSEALQVQIQVAEGRTIVEG